MKQSLGEMIDRLTIEVRKSRILGTEKTLIPLAREIASSIGLKEPMLLLAICRACDVNYSIWDLEKELKSDNEKELYLKEIGRRALLIRETNKQRISIKNSINKFVGETSREEKIDHGSE